MDVFTVQAKQLLVQRIKARYEQGTLHGIFTLGQYYSPEDIIKEVEMGTSVGEQILLAEKKLHDENLAQLKRLGG